MKFVSIASNGFGSQEIINKTSEYLAKEKAPLSVNLSIDGTRDVHNFIRGNRYSFDNCLVTLDGLWEIKKNYPHFYLGVNLVLMDLNSHGVERFFEYFRNRYNGLSIDIELLRPSKRDKDISLPNCEDIEKTHKMILACRAQTMNGNGLKKKIINFIEFSQRNYLYKIQRMVLRGGKFPMRCLAGQTNAVIGACGEVLFCEPLSAIGNLRECDYEFWKVWNSEEAERLRDKIRRERCSCTHCVNIYASIDYSLWSSLVKAPLARLRERQHGN